MADRQQPTLQPALKRQRTEGSAEARRLEGVISRLPAEAIKKHLLETLAQGEAVGGAQSTAALSAVFPAETFPVAWAHCVRCHKSFDVNFRSGCRIGHGQRDGGRPPSEKTYCGTEEVTWAAQFHRCVARDGDYRSRWRLACCGKSYFAPGTSNADDADGLCFEGTHTTDVTDVKYNGINIYECGHRGAGARSLYERHGLGQQNAVCKHCGTEVRLPDGSCICEHCVCGNSRTITDCSCGAHERAAVASGLAPCNRAAAPAPRTPKPGTPRKYCLR